MRTRTAALLTSSTLGATVLAAPVLVPAARAADDSSWCTASAPPCVVSVSRDGVPVAPGDASFDVRVAPLTGASKGASWYVDAAGGSGLADLGAGERGRRWAVTLDLGTTVPRVRHTYGAGVQVRREQTGAGWRVTVAAEPVRTTANDECVVSGWPWLCPELATDGSEAYLAGEVTDYGAWSDPEQRAAMHGLDVSTDVAVTSVPPEVQADPATGAQQLLLRLANQTRHPDGTTFRGFVHARVPDAFLRLAYGIDDPASLTSAGLAVGAGSGSATVTPGDGATDVRVDGITFPLTAASSAVVDRPGLRAATLRPATRTLKVRRGTITPLRPAKVAAKRLSPRRARVTYRAARPRGSAVTRHVVRCAPRAGRGVVTVRDKKPGTVVKGLAAGRAYRCQVRGVAKAGKGPWSTKVEVPARPRAKKRR